MGTSNSIMTNKFNILIQWIVIYYIRLYSCIYENVYARMKYLVISHYCKFVLKSHGLSVPICIIRMAERQTLLERNETILCIFIVVLLAFLLCYLCCLVLYCVVCSCILLWEIWSMGTWNSQIGDYLDWRTRRPVSSKPGIVIIIIKDGSEIRRWTNQKAKRAIVCERNRRTVGEDIDLICLYWCIE